MGDALFTFCGSGHGRSVEMIGLLLERMRALGYATVLPEDLPG